MEIRGKRAEDIDELVIEISLLDSQIKNPNLLFSLLYFLKFRQMKRNSRVWGCVDLGLGSGVKHFWVGLVGINRNWVILYNTYIGC